MNNLYCGRIFFHASRLIFAFLRGRIGSPVLFSFIIRGRTGSTVLFSLLCGKASPRLSFPFVRGPYRHLPVFNLMRGPPRHFPVFISFVRGPYRHLPVLFSYMRGPRRHLPVFHFFTLGGHEAGPPLSSFSILYSGGP